jgi:hypothetical protein
MRASVLQSPRVAAAIRLVAEKQRGGRIREVSLGGADVKADYQGEYAYYEFNGEGIFEDAGSSFVVGGGIRPSSDTPRARRRVAVGVAEEPRGHAFLPSALARRGGGGVLGLRRHLRQQGEERVHERRRSRP